MDSRRELAKVFGALSHPARLLLLQLLAQEEQCVCHLTAVLRQRQPYVSQQLSVLRDAGLSEAEIQALIANGGVIDGHLG